MGVDAQILIRGVSPDLVSREWLKELSWRLCDSIGAEHFFISAGLPPEEYETVSKAWHESFNAHPLYKAWHKAEGGERKSLHEQIFADVGVPPKDERMAIERTMERYREADAPAPGKRYQQDGPDIDAFTDECLLEVHLCGRYYGEGYERGDILTYCAVAEWIEANIPGCEIWYGGDSSGICAKPFTEAIRKRFRQHLYSTDGRDYFKNDSWVGKKLCEPDACSLCPNGKYCGTQYGTGAQYAAFNCGGCGKSAITRDNGNTWTDKEDGA